jgi:phospho-N-acetylmuramoyl-pentapeptide-transferase
MLTPVWIALLLPLVLFILLAPGYIGYLQRKAFGQYIRDDGPQAHHSKKGTPTAGGGLMIPLWALCLLGLAYGVHAQNPNLVCWPVLWLTLSVTGLLWLLGLWDDVAKLLKQQNKGVNGYTKLALQALAGLIVGWVLVFQHNLGSINWFGQELFLGWLYIPYAMFVVMAISNAVNLTDGLDGLAAGNLVVSFLAICTTIALLIGTNSWVALAGTPWLLNIALIALVTIGVLIGFLCFNRYPAKLFMGDSGSLALGGTLATLTLLARQDTWFLFFGFIYIAEAVSVILQVISFKTTGKRLFKMAPIHHHFELLGWHETKVVRLFIITQLVMSSIGFLLQLTAS